MKKRYRKDEKGKVLLIGFLGCSVSMAGIVISLERYAEQKEVVSGELAEQIQLEICLLDSENIYEEQLLGLLPGEIVERKPAVILDGTSPDAYLRIKLEFGGSLKEPEEKETEEEHRERINRTREIQDGIRFCDGWLEGDGGFYYYQKKVLHGSIIPVYDQIVIPENWDNEMAEQVFTIELSAEAVRADALEPWLLTEGEEEEIRGWD